MPDIEKRLEAFVRMGHGIIVFPGGVGTAEEILYLLGILLREDNAGLPLPADPDRPDRVAAPYFEQIDQFIRLTLGDAAAERYEIIVDDPATVAQHMACRHPQGARISHRAEGFVLLQLGDADCRWRSSSRSRRPHEAMAALDLHHGRKPH
jgi:predicted Rossmann-fold nucleotide-binding protein